VLSAKSAYEEAQPDGLATAIFFKVEKIALI
jgi:hypothetical protein